jgi:hypothetical protein
MKTVHCRICHKAIKGLSFAARMKRLRHHYKASHPLYKSRKKKRSPVKRKGLRSWLSSKRNWF